MLRTWYYNGLFASLDDLVPWRHASTSTRINTLMTEKRLTVHFFSSSQINEKRDRVRKSVAQGYTTLH